MALKDKIKIIPRRLIKDDRGWFLKVITGTEENIPNHTGEVYLTMGKSGQTKGGHYHPKAVEWFTLITGKALLKLEDIQTHEKLEMEVSFDDAITVYVPNGIAHAWENIGNEDFILLAYTDLLYNPIDTIKYDIV